MSEKSSQPDDGKLFVDPLNFNIWFDSFSALGLDKIKIMNLAQTVADTVEADQVDETLLYMYTELAMHQSIKQSLEDHK